MKNCDRITDEDLLALVDREACAAEAARLCAHLEHCAPCARRAALLRHAGELVARMPRVEAAEGFTARVLRASRERRPAPPAGRLRQLWPAAASAAAVLVIALGVRAWLAHGVGEGDVLTAAEERAIAADLLLLTNLEALEQEDAETLIRLVDELDVLESDEPELTGLFDEARTEEPR